MVVVFATPAFGQAAVVDGVPPGPDIVSCADAMAPPTAVGSARVERAVLCLVNSYRQANGRAPLHATRALVSSARDYGRQMVREVFFGHIDPRGRTLRGRLRAHHYLRRADRRWLLAENIAVAGSTLATAHHLVGGWMASPEHRSNILRSTLRDVGVGVVAGAPSDVGPDPYTIVMDLGARR